MFSTSQGNFPSRGVKLRIRSAALRAPSRAAPLLRHCVPRTTELSSSSPLALSTMSSPDTHSMIPPAPEPPAASSGAAPPADQISATCGGGVPHRSRTDDRASQHVHVSVRVGPCAVSSSGAVPHVGDHAWKQGARCVCPSSPCAIGGGGVRVRIPPGARVWFECPSCGLLFGSVADFGRHECGAPGSGGVGGSPRTCTSGRASSRT